MIHFWLSTCKLHMLVAHVRAMNMSKFIFKQWQNKDMYEMYQDFGEVKNVSRDDGRCFR